MLVRLRKAPGSNPPQLVGSCLVCGGKIYYNGTDYRCRNIHDDPCDFWLRENKLNTLGKESISIAEMTQLLENKVIDLPGLVKKNGDVFDGNGVLAWSEKYGWHIHVFDRGFNFETPEGKPSEVFE